RPRAASRVRARFRGEPADRARGGTASETAHLSVDVGSLWNVFGCAVRSRAFRPRARSDQQAALDLFVCEAADGPRDPRVWPAGRPRLHAVPAVQLDRRGARLDQHREGRQLAFTYIDDGIAALMKIIENRDGIATRKIYNIGHPANNYSVRELAQTMLS